MAGCEAGTGKQRCTRMYWLQALTPLHVGSGQGAGAIDLPVMRERITGWPMVPGSSVKGVLSDEYAATDSNRKSDVKLRAAFGLQDNVGGNYAGSLVFSDARIICLPVRSLYGTFAWLSCSLALERLRRDLVLAGLSTGLPPVCTVPSGQLYHGTDSALVDPQGRAFLEDLDVTAQVKDITDNWEQKLAPWVFPHDGTWQAEFRKRFAIIDDDTFGFLCETATEIAARVRIEDEKKTVQRGALWYEEALPCETLLAGIVWCDRVFVSGAGSEEDLMNAYCEKPRLLQLGGKASTGKGRVRLVFIPTPATGVPNARVGPTQRAE